LRIATYNLKNLFVGAAGPTQTARRRAPPKRRAELKALAHVIGRVDADVLALQEVGGAAALDALNGLLTRPYAHARVVPGNSDRGIHLAYLSRLPFATRSHSGRALRDRQGELLREPAEEAADGTSALRLQRDLLRCDLAAGAEGLTLYNVHLKSPNQPRWRQIGADEVRAAECRLIAEVIGAQQRAEPRRPVVLLGDFNAPWDSESLTPLRSLGLVNLLEATRPPKAPTFWPGAGAEIDLVLATAAALPYVVRGSVHVHESQRARKGSDHYPVSFELQATTAANTAGHAESAAQDS
jgi:endonuclease/exonuclease/phosphatase family metal-dependent hydrolase